MTITPQIAPANLDFDTIKPSLKSYMQGQTQFRDYNFEGSGLSILLDVLASNTQYNAFLINMLANESFLDTAILRANVVSLAKMLNYVPASSSAPVANIRVAISNVPTNPTYITIDRTYRFVTSVNGTTYSFVPESAQTIQINAANQYVAAFNIYEGQFVQTSSAFDATQASPKFVIPSAQVDLSFLKVYVYASGAKTGTPVEYTLATDISKVTPNDLVYYVQENQDGFYEVYFGDGILGKRPTQNSLVVLDYLLTNNVAANFASTFSKTANIANSANIIITTLDAASGALQEDIERIRLLAPKFNTTQNRAVTADDFKTIIKKEYPSVASVAVWGGEDADPVAYGQVFAALKPISDTIVFSETVKAAIADNLKTNYMVVAVRPVILDPDYVYAIVNSDVRYDGLNTDKTASEIVALVNAAINQFFADNLNDFEKTLRYSKLVAYIDAAAPEIKGNYTTLQLKKVFTPTLDAPRDYTINFSNPVAPGSVSSNDFIIQGTAYEIKDVPIGNIPYSTGNIIVFRNTGSSDIIIQNNLGTIDYSTGKITLHSFAPSAISSGTDIEVFVSPSTSKLDTDISTLDYNIYTNGREQIIVRDSLSATINAISEINNA